MASQSRPENEDNLLHRLYSVRLSGNHIFYSLGEGKEVKSLVIEGPEGLEMHEENEVSELLSILKNYNISETEKQIADKYYIELENLMDYGFGFFDEEFDEEEE